MTGSPSRWRSAMGGHSPRAIAVFVTLFGLALCSRARVLWVWKTAPAFGDLLGLASELLVAGLVAVLLCRLSAMVCGLVAAFWSLMCLVDGETLVALQTVAHVDSAGYFFDSGFLRMTLTSASVPHLLSALGFFILPPVFLLLYLRRVDSRRRPKPKPIGWSYLAFTVVVVALITMQSLMLEYDLGWRQKSFALVHLEQLAGMFVRSPEASLGQALPEDADVMAHDLSGEAGQVGGARNVLVVILEGIPGAYVRQIADYFGVTPPIEMTGLGGIARESLVVPNFLTHKQQTIRGLYAVLCADYPKLGGGTPKALEMLDAGDRKPNCLPAILASHGFRTAFIQAAPLEYMSKSTVMPVMGFQVVRGRESFQVGEGPHRGWGPRDREFFRQVVGMIEELDARGEPWFAALLTVGTHHPFHAPQSEVERYGNQKSAAVMATDAAVAEFFAELVARGVAEDTLIIVTSDESHGVPDQPHGSAWGLMLAHGPDLVAGTNPGVFGSIDTSISILDYLGIEPDVQTKGRSTFRSYDEDRTMLFAVGRDIAMTESKGVYHICRQPGLGALMSESRRYDCRTQFTDSGEMFAPSYQHDTTADHLASYQKLFRLQGLLDSSVADTGASSHLVLARNVVTPAPGRDDFWLLGGQFFEVPPGSAARVSMTVRFDSNDDRGLRLHHYWVVRSRTSGITRDLRIADFVVPAVFPGDRLELVFNVSGVAGQSQVEAIVKGRAEAGVVVVEEYAIEFVDDPNPETEAFELVDARMRTSIFKTKRLDELTLADGGKRVAALPLYPTGRTIRLTDHREHLAYTMLDGWWATEEWASWTRERARIYLDLREVSADQLFTIEMASSRQSVSDQRQVELFANGRRVTTWSVPDVRSPFTEYQAVIRAELLHPGVNILEIHPVGELESPFDLGRSRDKRELGVGVRSFSIRRAEDR